MLNKFGILGSILAGMAIGSCCLGAPAAVVVSSLGLGFLANMDVGLPILYGMMALILGGNYISYRRNRQVPPLVIAPLGMGMVLYPLHFVTELWLFRFLIYGGLALIVISSIWGLMTCRRRDGKEGCHIHHPNLSRL